MKELQQWFTQHPQEQQMTYWEHLKRAWSLGFSMGKGCIALLIHGICPQWFQTTGTDTIKLLYYEIVPKSPPPIMLSGPPRIPPLETS